MFISETDIPIFLHILIISIIIINFISVTILGKPSTITSRKSTTIPIEFSTDSFTTLLATNLIAILLISTDNSSNSIRTKLMLLTVMVMRAKYDT